MDSLSRWQLLEALGINSRAARSIAYAIQQSTGNVHAVLLTPRRSSVAVTSDASVAVASHAANVPPSLSENVRRLHSAGARSSPGDPSASHPLRKSGSITWAADYSFVPDLTVSGFNGSFHFHAKESITTLLGGSVVVV